MEVESHSDIDRSDSQNIHVVRKRLHLKYVPFSFASVYSFSSQAAPVSRKIDGKSALADHEARHIIQLTFKQETQEVSTNIIALIAIDEIKLSVNLQKIVRDQ